MSRTARLAGLLVTSFALCVPGNAEGRKERNGGQTLRPVVPTENTLTERINRWTVGLAGGLLEGAPIRLATEIARVVNDGENLHVLPIVTRGPTENVNDLLYLKGVDMAIINSDSLEEYKSQVPDIQQRLNLYPESVSVRTAYLRSAGNSIAPRPRGQEGQLQYARHRGSLHRPTDLQPPGYRCE